MAKEKSLYQRWGKRIFGLVVTVPALILFSPLIGIIAIILKFNLGGAVVFHQKRPGLEEKPFTIYKFRTMIDARYRHGNLLSDAERMTSFGILLRRLSLDELPTLLNVIKGDMSLVGPRPLFMRISIDGRGRLYDNIFVERLWRTVKYDEVYLHDYISVPMARNGLGNYFKFYNTERPHASLAGKKPHDIYFGIETVRKAGFGQRV